MNPAIYYHPEAYTTSGPKLMGRNAAGESFLKGYLKYSKAKEFWVQVQKNEHVQQFAKTVVAMGRFERVKSVNLNNLAALSQSGLVYFPGPAIGEHVYHRALLGSSPSSSKTSNPHAAWSLCGITHTTSSAGAMDAIGNLITSPVQQWDAVICTSHAVKDNVQRLLQAKVNQLQERLGITKVVLPMLPVIPLGIHTEDFQFTEKQKQEAKAKVGADAQTLVVLYMGRLSFHAKAHPLAMYQALQKAAKAVAFSGQKIMLVECGWHANESIQKAYEAAAQLVCPDVPVLTLDGRLAEDRNTAWACADVFCSLSDNIQETFGIVPIEAMAAGLPVVVSDWDGYKDTVRDGIDGFRVPTCMPEAGLATDLAYRHALGVDTYDMYCGLTSSLISVDIDATAQAFVQLFQSANLRHIMGAAGQLRAQESYDWSVIIGQYEALWQEQTQMRMSAVESAHVSHPQSFWPERIDPFYAFALYPTQTLNAQTYLALTDASVKQAIDRIDEYKKLAMVSYAHFIMPTNKEIEQLLLRLEKQPQTTEKLVENLDAARKPLLMRSLVWLLKLGILKLA
jgi:starch synthase